MIEVETEKRFNIVDKLFGFMSDVNNYDLEKMYDHEFTIKNEQGDTVTYGYDENGFGIKEPGNQSYNFLEMMGKAQMNKSKSEAQMAEDTLNFMSKPDKIERTAKGLWRGFAIGAKNTGDFVDLITGGLYSSSGIRQSAGSMSMENLPDRQEGALGMVSEIAGQYVPTGFGSYALAKKILPKGFATLGSWKNFGRILLAELGMEFTAGGTADPEATNIPAMLQMFGLADAEGQDVYNKIVDSLARDEDDTVFEAKYKDAFGNLPVAGFVEFIFPFYKSLYALKHNKPGRELFAKELGLEVVKDNGLEGVFKVTNKDGEVIASFDNEELANKLVQSLGEEFEVQSFKEGGASVVVPDNINQVDDVTKMKSSKTGEMTVENQKLATKELETKLSTDMMKLSDEGAIGKNWYKDSGESILKYVGGDLDKADKFAQLIAIYSPQTNVPINTQFAIKAWNKFQAGIPIWEGDILKTVTIPEGLNKTQEAKFLKELLSEFGGGQQVKGQKSSGLKIVNMEDGTATVVRHGNYDNISAKDRDVKAHLVLTKNQDWGGRKTNAFYNNIIKSIDPNATEGITVDLWMARAFGFYDVNVGPVKYDFIEKFVKEVADKKGWEIEQAQASIWVATKARFEAVASKAKAEALTTGAGKLVKNKFTIVDPKKYFDIQYKLAFGEPLDADKLANSALSFADNLDNNLAQVSWESMPGDFTNHLIELRSAPNTMKAQYHTSVASLFVDADGHDILAKELGLLSPGDFEAPGFWDGVSNPSTQSQFATSKAKGTDIGEMDVAGKNLLDIYSSARGLVLLQDAVGYTRPSIIKTKSKANSMYVEIGRQLTAEETVTLGRAIDNPDIGLINGPDGIFVVNFSTMDNKTFIENIKDVVVKNLDDDIDVTIKYAQSDGNLLDWGKNGENYIRKISDQGRLDILETVASLLKKKKQFDEQFAKQHGYTFDGTAYDNIIGQIESALKQQEGLTTNIPSNQGGI